VGLLGLEWRIAPAQLDEDAFLIGEPPVAAVNIALAKAVAIEAEAHEVILAADTLVVIGAEILGKPTDAEAARAMLRRLRGRGHQVLTGVAMRSSDLAWAAVVSTRVLMRAYTDAEVEAYVARGEPLDKAGGYAVQDEVFRPVERVEGCYLNVVGLPLCAVAAGLATFGQDVMKAGRPPCEYCRGGERLVRSGL
jgi:MAF protein